MSGRVVLVGAGPGDPDLLTVRAVRELARAEVLLHDALISPAILALANPECERVDVGKRGDGTRGVSQDEIAKLMVERARAGRYVVRLKGGDPFLFGRGGEEASALVSAGIPFEVVPGITAALSVPAYAGIPVTDRRASSSIAIVTGHRAANRQANRSDWEGLARSAETLVVLMGTTWIEEIVERVLGGGRDPDTPVAVIAEGTTAAQRVVTGTLRDIASRVREAEMRAPTVIVIGEVARYRSELSWYEQRPLFGRRVLVLRAPEQRAELIERLARAGAEPTSVPLLAFEALSELPPARGEPEWVAFTSANAVRYTPAERIGSARVACIGAATARAARRAGLEVTVMPEGARPELLAQVMSEAGELRGAHVLLPQVVGGRDTLARALVAAGARVERVAVYRNVTPAGAAERLREALSEELDAVMLTSPSTVERFACAIGPARLRELAARSALVCIGETTAAALHAHGVERLRVAEQATSAGLVAALERHFSEGPHGVSE